MNRIGYCLLSFLLFIFPLIAKSQNEKEFHNSITNPVPLNYLNINDYLYSSIDLGNYQLVSYLLLKGADPNYSDKYEYSEHYGRSALMLAASHRYYKIAELLINKGADVNYKNLDGNTALFEAVKNLSDSITDLLIKNKALVNIKDENNFTPLQYSVGYNLLDYSQDEDFNLTIDAFVNHTKANRISELLIDAGADIDVTDSYGYTPLMIASQLNNMPLIKILFKAKVNVNVRSNDGITPLMLSADNGYYQVAKALIVHGADINISSFDGNSAIFAAVRANNDSIAGLLLQKKAFVNIKNSMGLSPLHYASGYGYPFMTNLLIANGASVDITDYNGNTPLMTSVYSGAKEVTQILIDSGADLNLKDNKGNTPLMIAAQFNDTLLVKKLSLAGARMDEFNKKKHNALSIALENNAVDAFKMLIDFGVKADSMVGKSYYQQAVERGNSDIALFLKKRGLNTRLHPNINGVNFYTGFSTSPNDFMVDIGVGVYEPITKMLVNIGYKYRPFASRVLEYQNSSFYQYWEKRYSFYVSLQHYFVLNKNFLKGNVGFMPGLSNEFSWRYYRGVNEGSGLKWFLVPSVGLFYQKNLVTIVGKWERVKYNSQITAANRFNLQILMTIPTRKRVINKKIDWLD